MACTLLNAGGHVITIRTTQLNFWPVVPREQISQSPHNTEYMAASSRKIPILSAFFNACTTFPKMVDSVWPFTFSGHIQKSKKGSDGALCVSEGYSVVGRQV